MIGVLSASSIHSETPEQKGYKIAEEASQRDKGFIKESVKKASCSQKATRA